MYPILTHGSQCFSKQALHCEHEHVFVNPASNVPIQYQFVSISHIVLFCALFVDIRSDHVSSGRSAGFRLLVSELACSVSMNSYSFSSFFSQFGREITCICMCRVIILRFSLVVYIYTSVIGWNWANQCKPDTTVLSAVCEFEAPSVVYFHDIRHKFNSVA